MADTTGNDGRGGGRNAGALLLRDAGDVREGLRAWSEALAHGGTGAWSVGGLALAILRGALAAARERGYPPPAGLFSTTPATSTVSSPQGSTEAPTLAAVLQALTDTARAQADLVRAMAAQGELVAHPRGDHHERALVPGPRLGPVAGETCPQCGNPTTLSPCVSCEASTAVCGCDEVLSRDGACETCAKGAGRAKNNKKPS